MENRFETQLEGNKITVNNDVTMLELSNDPKYLTWAEDILNTEGPLVVIIGGSKKISNNQRDNLMKLFRESFQNFKGILEGGATNDGGINTAIGLIDQLNRENGNDENTLIIGHLAEGKKDRAADFNEKLFLVHGENWGDEVDAYFEHLKYLKSRGKEVRVIAFNGGDITLNEMYKAIRNEIPLSIIKGSGRAVDYIMKGIVPPEKLKNKNLIEELKRYIDLKLINIIENDSDDLRAFISNAMNIENPEIAEMV